jgi:hypothetical protein
MLNVTISFRICLTLALMGVLGTFPAKAGPLDFKGDANRGTLQSIHEAEQAVDRAWETYHRAALGGTLASPNLQTEIELHLHEARTLLPRAQEAAEQPNHEQVYDLLREIHLHTQQATEGSMEHKR